MKNRILNIAIYHENIWWLIFGAANISLLNIALHNFVNLPSLLISMPLFLFAVWCAFYATILRANFIYYSRYIEWLESRFDYTKAIGIFYGVLAFALLIVLVFLGSNDFVLVSSILCCYEVGHVRFPTQLLKNACDWKTCKERNLSKETVRALESLEQIWNFRLIHVNGILDS